MSNHVSVQYQVNPAYTAEQFIDLLRRSTLSDRRPVDDLECIRQMVAEGNLAITAWQGKRLVGIARSVTDFAYCCYLSDLAVDHAFQGVGVGKRLIQLTQEELGPRCTLILLSAPDANDFYPHVGFETHPRAWVLPPRSRIR